MAVALRGKVLFLVSQPCFLPHEASGYDQDFGAKSYADRRHGDA
jgi:hypothetical protein